ncbi:DUF309 domain-containing protein [Paenibacillus sp. P26]|nr:DUF309 domain-containing protein [Paenibacillus sp. P26]UUZ94564.1 DUF309 domain-containing protein [Paenibacillus sp. P25]
MQSYPDAYIEYLNYFHSARDYFECHEVMEEFWKEHPDDPLRDTYEGLIQLAVAQYHHRRGNVAGAVKMLTCALHNMKPEHLERLGLEPETLLDLMRVRLSALSAGKTDYSDPDLPLKDAELLELCRKARGEEADGWSKPSDMNDAYLLNKHTLRDRSAVRREREQQFSRKRELRAKRDEG